MECDSNYNIVNSRQVCCKSMKHCLSLLKPIVLLLKRKWMPCILCPETLGVIGGLLMSSAELFHTIGRSGSSVYRFAIWSRWHPLTIFCSLHVTQEKNIEEDRRGCPFVWGWCVDTGTEWRLMGRPVWTTVTLFHCCRHANMWRLPSSAERLTDPTLP